MQECKFNATLKQTILIPNIVKRWEETYINIFFFLIIRNLQQAKFGCWFLTKCLTLFIREVRQLPIGVVGHISQSRQYFRTTILICCYFFHIKFYIYIFVLINFKFYIIVKSTAHNMHI